MGPSRPRMSDRRFLRQFIACKDVYSFVGTKYQDELSTVTALSNISMYASLVTVQTLPVSATFNVAHARNRHLWLVQRLLEHLFRFLRAPFPKVLLINVAI